jgi:hypothetical protein
VSLIKAVNEDKLNEFMSFLKKKKPSAPAAPPQNDDDESPDTSDSVSILHQFADAVKGAPSGSDRYVLRMSTSDLKQHYLKAGGGKSFIENLPDEVISKKEALESRIKLVLNYDVKKLIGTGKYDAIVLLDIPKDLTSKLVTAQSGAVDINGMRDALIRMMNHRYYAMTLSGSRLKKISGKINPVWNDLDALTRVLDPSVAIAYPSSSDFASIKQAFADQPDSREEPAPAEEEEEEEMQNPQAAGAAAAPVKPANDDISKIEDSAELAKRALSAFGSLNRIHSKKLNAEGLDDATIAKVIATLAKVKG